VGQNAPGLRARICQGLEWMGILLDEESNRSASVGPGEVAEISQAQSRAHVLVVGGNEEHLMARQAIRAVTQTRATDIMRRRPKPIPINVSAHHVHLTQEHVESLFGAGHTLTWRSDLTQPGQFACMEQVNLIGPKGRVDHVRVLGPVRPESQVEIARTEEFKLGVDAPIRMSGDLDGTPGMTLEGPSGTIHLRQGVICAMRHIHMSPQDAMEFAVRDHDVVRIGIAGERSLIFGDVVVRISPDFRLDMHVDTDEANAAEMPPKATGHLDSIQERASFAS
jgi:acetate kinase